MSSESDGSDSFWGRRRARKHTLQRTDELCEAIGALSADAAERVTRLEQRRLEVVGRVKEVPRLQHSLTDELGKLERLVDDFLALSLSAQRFEAAVRQSPPEELEAELRRAEDDAERALDAERRELARMQVVVLEQRRDALAGLRGDLVRIRAQLDLVENTYKLVCDEIRELEVTERDPGQELDHKLDDLLEGVRLVRSIEHDRREMLGLPDLPEKEA